MKLLALLDVVVTPQELALKIQVYQALVVAAEEEEEEEAEAAVVVLMVVAVEILMAVVARK